LKSELPRRIFIKLYSGITRWLSDYLGPMPASKISWSLDFGAKNSVFQASIPIFDANINIKIPDGFALTTPW